MRDTIIRALPTITLKERTEIALEAFRVLSQKKNGLSSIEKRLYDKAVWALGSSLEYFVEEIGEPCLSVSTPNS